MPSQRLKQAFVYDIKNTKTANVSRSIVVFLASAQLIFGFNFGFVKQMSSDYKMAAQILSITMGFIMSGYMAYNCIFNFILTIYTIQYIVTFLVLITSRYTLYEFLLDLTAVKTKIGHDPITDRIGIITWLYALFMFVFKFLIGILYILELENEISFIIRLIIMIPILALDGIPIANFLVFYYIYVKLKYLKLGFRNAKTSVFEVLDKYKNIMDLSDKITWTTDNLMILGFFADCPKFIVIVWTQLILFKTDATWTSQACNGLYWLHFTMQTCLPAICAEFVHAQGDALRVIAHEKMLHENDEKTRTSLNQLAGYMHARPPLPPAWRLLPLGLHLPTTIFSICTTHLIVVIQFTHIYD